MKDKEQLVFQLKTLTDLQKENQAWQTEKATLHSNLSTAEELISDLRTQLARKEHENEGSDKLLEEISMLKNDQEKMRADNESLKQEIENFTQNITEMPL